MNSNYAKSLKAVLKHEGGYVNHPKDPGGETNKGVTKAVYAAYRKRHGDPVRSVKLITDGEVSDIYKVEYWDRVGADDLPSGLDYAVFDFAVNSGVGRAKKYLAKTSGPATARINALCDARMAFLRALKTWPTFGKGWERRVSGVRLMALAMVKDGATEPQNSPPVSKPAPEPVEVPKPPEPRPDPVIDDPEPVPINPIQKPADIAAKTVIGGTLLTGLVSYLTGLPWQPIAIAVIGVAAAIGLLLFKLTSKPKE